MMPYMGLYQEPRWRLREPVRQWEHLITVENVGGTDVEMVQATDYPWKGNVAITVNPKTAKNFSLRIRVPDRGVSKLYTPKPEANGIASIHVNGVAVKPVVLRTAMR